MFCFFFSLLLLFSDQYSGALGFLLILSGINFSVISLEVNWRFFVIIIIEISMGSGYFIAANICCNIIIGWGYFHFSKFDYLGFWNLWDKFLRVVFSDGVFNFMDGVSKFTGHGICLWEISGIFWSVLFTVK